MKNGKGSVQRPLGVSKKQFSENWDKVFGKDCSKHKRGFVQQDETCDNSKRRIQQSKEVGA